MYETCNCGICRGTDCGDESDQDVADAEGQRVMDAELDAYYHWQTSIQPLESVPSFDDIPF